MKCLVFIVALLSALSCQASIFGTIATTSGINTGSISSLSASSINTASGDLMACAVRWSTVAATVTVADSSSSYSAGTEQQSVGGAIQLFYHLNSTANATNVPTATFSSASVFNFIFCWDVPISGGMAAFDVQSGNIVNSAVSTISTTSFSTTGTDELVLVSGSPNSTGETVAFTGYTLDSASIGGGGFGGAGHTTFSSTQSGIVSTMTWTPITTTAQIALISFKPSSGGASFVPQAGAFLPGP